MGIEGYARWLYEAHPKRFAVAPTGSERSFDHVYLDLNGHFHYWAYQVIPGCSLGCTDTSHARGGRRALTTRPT
jgi:hypothetical protein